MAEERRRQAGFKLWTPEWVQDAVFYQIFPDRFAQSARGPKPAHLDPWGSPPTRRGFQGGDLLGVVERLDYLEDLGITALYLNPVFTSPANHRYHTHDYFSVDPMLGGNAALDELLRECHDRGIRIILDGVFNHTGRSFYQFGHILENGPESPYLDWFHIESWPLRPYGPDDEPAGYAAWWDNRELPKLNTGTEDVRRFLWDVGAHWIERGIDGWRLDVPNEIDDDEFWTTFRDRVKAINPSAYLVGEIWGEAQRWLHGDQFDGVMNYPLTRACVGFFAAHGNGAVDEVVRNTGLEPIERLDACGFARSIERILDLYPWSVTVSQLNLLGSHDTPRFLTIAGKDTSALRLATLFQMTFPGAPCIYYGDEIGMVGGAEPDCRRAFPWDGRGWDEDLRSFVKRCVELRRRHEVLRRGRYGTLWAEGDAFVFERRLDGGCAVVALNVGQVPVEVPLPSGGYGRAAEGALGEAVVQVREGGTVLRLPARSGDVVLT